MPDRRDDDRPVRPRIESGPALRPGLVRHQGRDGGDAHRLRPAGPRAARRGRRRCSWPARSTRSSRTPARRAWPTTPHGADLAIVAEPTRLDIVDCHKGAVRWKIRTQGRRLPQLDARTWAINAIYRMARVVAALAGPRGRPRRVPRPDPVLGPPSLSVGRIEGGQSVNVVPDWCEIEVDRRIIPGETPAAALGAGHDDLLRRLGDDAGGWIEFLPPWVNMPALSPAAASAGRWQERVAPAMAPVAGPARPRSSGFPTAPTPGRWESRDSPAWSSGRATSPRHTPRTSGSSSTRSGSPRRRTIEIALDTRPRMSHGVLSWCGKTPSLMPRNRTRVFHAPSLREQARWSEPDGCRSGPRRGSDDQKTSR